MTDMPKKFLTVQDLAVLFRTTPKAIRQMHARGLLPPPANVPVRRLLWSERTVTQWLNRMEPRKDKP